MSTPIHLVYLSISILSSRQRTRFVCASYVLGVSSSDLLVENRFERLAGSPRAVIRSGQATHTRNRYCTLWLVHVAMSLLSLYKLFYFLLAIHLYILHNILHFSFNSFY